MLTIVMSFLIAFRLRKPLHGLIAEYGHKLMLVIVIQIITLATSTVYYAFYIYDIKLQIFFSKT